MNALLKLNDIIEITNDLKDYEEIVHLLVDKKSIYRGSLTKIKGKFLYWVKSRQSIIKLYGGDINQFTFIICLINNVKLINDEDTNGVSIEFTFDVNELSKLQAVLFSIQGELVKINKNHPHIVPIRTVMSRFENEIFVYKGRSKQSYLHDKFKLIEKSLTEWKIQEASVELLGFRGLLHDIDVLKFYKSSHVDKLLRTLLKCPASQFYGIRYEILISKVLTVNNLTFTKPEPPDFLVTYQTAKIKIECTSKHFTDFKNEENLMKGLYSAIDMKDDPKYNFDYNTVLAIDVTNIGYFNKNFFAQNYHRNISLVKKKLDTTRFGAIILSYWILDKSNHAYVNIYTRINSNKIGYELSCFLDKYWPNNHNITSSPNFRAPKIG